MLKYPLIILRTEFPSNNKQSSFFNRKKKLFSEAHIGYIQYLHIHIVHPHKTCQEKKEWKSTSIFHSKVLLLFSAAKRVMGSYIICGIDGMETNGYIIMLYCIHVLNIGDPYILHILRENCEVVPATRCWRTANWANESAFSFFFFVKNDKKALV